jgi:hypothetical protein
MNNIKDNLFPLSSIGSKDLSKEWNYAETKGMESIIHDFFRGQKLKNHEGKTLIPYSKKDIDDVFGLPYTSSSSYAMLSADCNNHIYLNEHEYIDHFALKNGQPIMVTSNSVDEQKYYAMEVEK